MKVIEKKIEELIPYHNNPRNNKDAISYIAKSIETYGFRNPILVDKDMVIIAGHTRLEASKTLGLKTVPVVICEDMTEAQVKAFRIAENKTGEYAEWDYVKLLQEIEDLEEMDFTTYLTGFDMYELDKIADSLEDDEFEIEEEEIELEREEGQETNKQLNTLTFGKHKVSLTDEEYALLENKYNAYIIEHKNAYGFILDLLGD